ncbi:MAG: hypothetical protein GWO20_12705 [Candidatus Korarchaeota archaeon]|nr:hypothetical protein [Candidatus Korarchaeota archaeon]
MDLDELVELCHTDVSKNKEYLGLEKDDKGRYFLKVLTKKYQDTMYMYDFRDRMEKERDKYGKRAKEAKDMNGNDWKALSHSLRTLFEANEMLSKGFVNYPLNSSDLLKKVKEGEVSFDEFEEAYGSMRKMVDDLASSNPQTNRLDKNAQRQMVLNLYRKDSGDEQRTD